MSSVGPVQRGRPPRPAGCLHPPGTKPALPRSADPSGSADPRCGARSPLRGPVAVAVGCRPGGVRWPVRASFLRVIRFGSGPPPGTRIAASSHGRRPFQQSRRRPRIRLPGWVRCWLGKARLMPTLAWESDTPQALEESMRHRPARNVRLDGPGDRAGGAAGHNAVRAAHPWSGALTRQLPRNLTGSS